MELSAKRRLRAAEIVYLLVVTTGPFFQNIHVNSVRVKKPVYAIVHMVNSIDKIDYAMRRGANAIQMDVEVRGNGSSYDVHYGTCNCLPEECSRREEFARMLEYIRESTHAHTAKYGTQLCLVVLHLKLELVSSGFKYKAGVCIAQKLVHHLWYAIPQWNGMNVLMSVKYADDIDVIRGANDTVNRLLPLMRQKIGYDARDEKELWKLRAMYKKLGLPGPYWQGEGSSTCVMKQTTAERLQTILDERDTDSDQRYAQKVYHWVIDIPVDMKRSFERGVDAIITNRAGRLHSVLKHALNKTHRLATIVDNPWKWFDGWSPFLRMPATGNEQLGDDDLKIVRGIND